MKQNKLIKFRIGESYLHSYYDHYDTSAENLKFLNNIDPDFDQTIRIGNLKISEFPIDVQLHFLMTSTHYIANPNCYNYNYDKNKCIFNKNYQSRYILSPNIFNNAIVIKRDKPLIGEYLHPVDKTIRIILENTNLLGYKYMLANDEKSVIKYINKNQFDHFKSIFYLSNFYNNKNIILDTKLQPKHFTKDGEILLYNNDYQKYCVLTDKDIKLLNSNKNTNYEYDFFNLNNL